MFWVVNINKYLQNECNQKFIWSVIEIKYTNESS